MDRGSLSVEGNKLVISNANSVKIVLPGDTNYNGFDKSPSEDGVDPFIVASANLNNALRKSYRNLRKDHLEDYQELFKRMKFRIWEMSGQL